jgi:hypothetical protein
MRSSALALGAFAVGFAVGREEVNAFIGVFAAGLAGAICMIGLMTGYVLVALRTPLEGSPRSAAAEPPSFAALTPAPSTSLHVVAMPRSAATS